jgi:aspartyl-tRNA(Asn)/glutamyl-tRNA(Gln) amidotransferase subunit B
MSTRANWEVVIGLEVHAQLNTQSKIFSGASTNYGALPNTQACGLDIALPGTLPALNEAVVEKAVRLGLAIDASVEKYSVFDRKNYFYPDLPKGYQISQFFHPIVQQGKLDITLEDSTHKTIGITRAHLEEDAGKSLHEDFAGMTGIDLNRAGTPLLEIVSEPDMRSASEAVAYLKTLHALVRAIDICDGNMQEGSFRCDANVSVRRKGEGLGTRAEIKNINSFRFVEKAILYEVERQIDLIESGGKVVQETRLYDPDKNETRSMRSKENANDYRYFPDPDLLPVIIDDSFIEKVRKSLPELPSQKHIRFKTQYALGDYDAALLTADKDMADYFENVARISKASPKIIANWILGDLSAALNKSELSITQCPIDPMRLSSLLARVEDGSLSSKLAKTLFEHLWTSTESADTLIEKLGLKQMDNTAELEAIIQKIIADNPKSVEDYRAGKDKLFGFFVGQVMKATGGKANPQKLNELLKKHLNAE